MLRSKRSPTQSQAEIFASYGWWDRHNLLNIITASRCDYIQHRVERVLGKSALRQQEILEVGCGGGLICEELARRGAVVTGLDPTEEALAVARAHTQRSGFGQNAHFVRGYAESLPFADGSFSVIVCLDVLEHVRALDATVKELARVLAPGGILIFDTINRTPIARLVLIWIGERFFHQSGLVPGLHHYHAFIKPQELRTLLIKNNLQVRELVGFMPYIHKGRFGLRPGWFKGVSYVGYATKQR